MKPLNRMFVSTRSLASLGERLSAQQALLERIRPLLPAPLEDHCVWAILRDSDLTLLVDSPAWANRLRYLVPQLKQQLLRHGLQVRNIRIKVTILRGDAGRRTRHRKANPLSRANAELLDCVARGIEDEGLRNALLRLSRRAKL
jgi:hypothetical protein